MENLDIQAIVNAVLKEIGGGAAATSGAASCGQGCQGCDKPADKAAPVQAG